MTSADTSAAPATRDYRSIDNLSVSLADGVLSVTFNRPDSLNSLTQAMLDVMADALELAAGDPDVRVVRRHSSPRRSAGPARCGWRCWPSG